MGDRKKKFDACLLRVDSGECVVAEWHQLVTTTDKSKLGVGSCVGYKASSNKREKVVRGTIVVIDDKSETKSTTSKQVEVSVGKQKNQVKISKEILPTNDDDDDDEEPASISLSCKRTEPDTETDPPPPPKRSMVSLARLEELQLENNRLKNQNEKYKAEWMPRPTDPAVIRYIVRMGELFSSGGESAEGKGEKLANACSILDVEEKDLNRWQRPNGTKTARAIVRAFYPPDVRVKTVVDDIDSNFRQAIHDIVNVYHAMEGLTEGRINESINNVFRSAKKQQKDKVGKQQKDNAGKQQKDNVGKQQKDNAGKQQKDNAEKQQSTRPTIDISNTTKKKKHRINTNDKENIHSYD